MTTPAAPKLEVAELASGSGPAAREGDWLTVHYVGRLAGGAVFDDSHERREPLRFRLGAGDMIEGWEQGLRGMRPQGKRRLRVPPELGYGNRGAGERVPPGATLEFEIELVRIG